MSLRVLVSFVFFCLAWATPAFAGVIAIANVVAVVGNPTSSGPGGNRTLAAGNAIFENDKITVTSGNAQILFLDGTKLVVGPSSALVINKYLMRGDGSTAQDFSIKALRGTFRFITGTSPKDAYDIQTANATIGIRGTGFDFWVNDSTSVAVLNGKVRLKNKLGKHDFVDLNPTCELGTTENRSAKKMTGENAGHRLRNHLPYILDQSKLKKSFWLNLNSCKSALAATEPLSGKGSPEPPARGGKG